MMIRNSSERTRSPLASLAEACGIEDGFVDARGERHETGDAVRRALLEALGIAASTDDDVRASHERVERETWFAVMPPVCVRTTAAVSVSVTLRATTPATAWHLRCEDGSERRGTFEPASVAVDATATIDGERYERRTLRFEPAPPLGYHALSLGDARTTLVVAPERCYVPPTFDSGARAWGVSLQLYLLKSERNWGIGDFADLTSLATLLGARGADVLGLNPLHALFPDDPEHASPYSPASRSLLNVLNVDVTAAPGYETSPAIAALVARDDFARDLAEAKAASFVRYADVARVKLAALRALHAERRAAYEADYAAFETFARAREASLGRACAFLALRDVFGADWRTWPEGYREPSSAAVDAFVATHQSEVAFYGWTQWLADEQLGDAAAAAREAGMVVGLYRDLAVGVDPRGIETWTDADALVSGAHVGAPPDIHNPAGQDWGLPPFHPARLRANGYASFIALLRANMRHAGAIRIDHVMALQHVYAIPAGASPADGAYLAYAIDDLVGIIALESVRNRCLVIGEDLGTVPEGFRERMAAANVLSYRVLYFETEPDGDRFVPPERYPRTALAVVGNHDLPTLRAWFAGDDIDLKERLGRYPDASEARRQRATRARDRDALRASLADANLLAAGTDADDDATLDAVHRFIARSPAMLALAQLDDLTGEDEQVNVPATSDERPNWRRRQSLALEAFASDARFARAVAAFAAERTR